jgi:hypothetical protein
MKPPAGMKVQSVALDSLKAPERNVRVHPETQIVELMRAVSMFGQTRPVIIDEASTVLAGNGLVMALRRLGAATVQVYRIAGLSKQAKHKLMLSDNKIFMLGHDDYDGIMALVRGLDDDFDIPGFDANLLSSLIANDSTASTAMKGLTSDSPPPPNLVGTLVRSGGRSTVTCPHCGNPFDI